MSSTISIADALKRSLRTTDSDEFDAASLANEGFSGHAFVIANIGFLLPASCVEEVTGSLQYCELPHAVRWFWGMTNVRGNLLPVFDFSDLFGFGQSDRRNNHVVILRTGDEVFGIVIADFPTRIDLKQEDELGRSPPMPTPLKGFVRKSYSKDGQIWIDWYVQEFMESISA